jgi:uncharacterized protein (DUF1499 family)
MMRLLLNGLVLFTLIGLWGCGASKPKDLGMNNGQFKPCPSSPNCVSTQADTSDEEHYMAPIPYQGSRESAQKKIMAVIDEMPRTKVLKDKENYIHVTFTTRIMRYVDDVEFYLPADDKLIHFRSASRLGYSDMGKNRERMNTVKEKFAKQSIE